MKHFISSLAFIFFLSTIVTAQIEDEVKSYVDSTEIIINNGRKIIAKSINKKDFNKIGDVYNYLNEETAQSNYSAFYYTEELYINLLLRNWQKTVEIALNYYDYNQQSHYNNNFNILDVLWKEIQDQRDSIYNDLISAPIPKEEQDLLELFVYLLKVENPDKEYTQKLKNYKKQYPESRFNAFIKEYLPPGYTKYAMAFSIGSGTNITTGKLNNHFPSNAGFNMSVDFNIGKVYCSLYLNGSGHKLQIPFSAINTDNETYLFEKDERFSYLDAGLKMGYFALRNQHLQLAPYISVSGGYLQSNIFDDVDDNDKELKIFNSFCSGPGLHTEIKIIEFSHKSIYNTDYKSYFSLKVDGGFSYITKYKLDGYSGNIGYVNISLVWGLGEF